jgi:hypothetical protein
MVINAALVIVETKNVNPTNAMCLQIVPLENIVLIKRAVLGVEILQNVLQVNIVLLMYVRPRTYVHLQATHAHSIANVVVIFVLMEFVMHPKYVAHSLAKETMSRNPFCGV